MTERQGQEMFSTDELDNAAALLREYPERPITPALRFHTALKGLIMDANRSQKQESSDAILALDSVEIIAHANYSRPHYNAFTFNDLITGDSNWNAQVEDLDHLISQQLLTASRIPFILLDSYAQEIQDVWSAIENRKRDRKEELFPEKGSSGKIEFPPDALRRIRDHISGQRADEEVLEEFKKFRDDFMPSWSMKIVRSLIGHKTTIQKLGEVLRTSDFVYLRGPEFGNRSVARAITDFDWDRFQEFVDDDAVVREFEAVRSAIAKLASVPKFGRNPDAVTIVAENDALAFADIHTVNTFLRKTGRQERVELVTRSSLLANILRAMPSGRLDVPLRHPLLLPDVFEFDEGAQSAITEISQRFDAVLTPYLEDYEGGASVERRQEEVDLRKAKEIARDLVRWLRDTAVAQVSRKQEVMDRVLFQSVRTGKNGGRDATAAVIREIFDTLIQNLDQPENPFTTTTLRDLARRNRDMASVIWDRTIQNGELVARTLKIDSPRLSPAPMMALRILPHKYTRLFYLHSKRGRNLLEEKFREQAPAGQRPDAHAEVEVRLSRADTLDEFDKLLESLTDSTDRSGDLCYLCDITLVICAAFASKGEMNAAASLASTVLHDISVMMRRQDNNLGELQLVERLALQELFIFRQYCERSTAISNFFKNRRHPTVQVMRGLLEKDFARAQRDLDRAAELDASLANAEASELVRAVRLRLVHMSGWMDMFLMTDTVDLERKYDWPEGPLLKLGSRRDIWAAVGYAKECLDDQERVRALAQECDGNECQRFLAHLEARILQNFLVMFLLLVFSKNVPFMDRVLMASHRVQSDHMLKFGEYAGHWNQLEDLIQRYHFQFRLHDLYKLVLSAIHEVDKVRASQVREKTKHERSAAVWARVSDNLRSQYCQGPSEGFSRLFAEHIVRGIESKGLNRTAFRK
ncbi:MAG TPA: hypothetical protein ENJ52_04130 [Aliiroseovarius sp.]|nr:hypothetical protein [Aliiroseovarius sp.]